MLIVQFWVDWRENFEFKLASSVGVAESVIVVKPFNEMVDVPAEVDACKPVLAFTEMVEMPALFA